MGDDDVVLCSDLGPIRVLTMNCPAARNTLISSLIGALYTALKEADNVDTVHRRERRVH